MPPLVSPISPLVGRDGPRRALSAVLDRVVAGAGSIVLLSGEAGIGKSRLAEELAALAASRGAVVAWGQCHEGEGAPPMWPWIQVLRHLVRVVDPVVVADAAAPVIGDLAQIIPEVKELVDSFIASAVLDPVAARFRLGEAVGEFLSRLSAAAPLVVVIDDLHWADTATLELTEFVAAHHGEARLLLAMAYRQNEVPPGSPLMASLGGLARRPDLTRIALEGLSPNEAGQYFAHVAGWEPPPDVVASVWARTDGNPFFVGELARLLASEGVAGGQPASLSQVPAGVRDVLYRRLAQLPTTTVGALEIAAVIGSQFDLRVVAAVLGEDVDTVAEALEPAELLGLVSEDPHGVGRFRFAHALVQEALYAELAGVPRARLHGRVAEAIEALPDAAGRLDELAHHFFQAAPVTGPDQALAYAFQAADAARHLAYEKAEQHLLRAVDLAGRLPEGPDRLRVQLQARIALAVSLTYVRGYDSPLARDEWAEAERLARLISDPVPLQEAMFGHVMGAFGRGDLNGTVDLCGRLLELGSSTGNRPCIICAHVLIGVYHFFRGELSLSAERLIEARRLCDDPPGEPPWVGMIATFYPSAVCRFLLGMVVWFQGDEPASKALVDDGLVVARASGHPVAIGVSLWFTSILGLLQNDPVMVAARSSEVCELADRHGLTDFALWGRTYWGWAEGYLGDREDGVATMERGLVAIRAVNRGNVFVIGKMADLYLAVGRPEDALRSVDDAMRLLAETGERLFESELYRIKGEALAALGPENADQAFESLARAIAVADRQGARPFARRAEASLARLAHAERI
jgi:tetratricopeptide (TPR) repeat protein